MAAAAAIGANSANAKAKHNSFVISVFLLGRSASLILRCRGRAVRMRRCESLRKTRINFCAKKKARTLGAVRAFLVVTVAAGLGDQATI